MKKRSSVKFDNHKYGICKIFTFSLLVIFLLNHLTNELFLENIPSQITYVLSCIERNDQFCEVYQLFVEITKSKKNQIEYLHKINLCIFFKRQSTFISQWVSIEHLCLFRHVGDTNVEIPLV